MTSEELSYLIRSARKKRGWSRQKVADRIGISAMTVRRYETDLEGLSTFETLRRILGVLGYELTVVRRRDAFDK